jgi:hypothetical protein
MVYMAGRGTKLARQGAEPKDRSPSQEYPWYARMRVFLPEKFGAWAALMPEVSDELEVWASGAERKAVV